MSASVPISICSYSFHRLLAAGKQDVFGFIAACKDLGCSELDPWNGHIPALRNNAPQVTGGDLKAAAKLSDADQTLVAQIKQAGQAAGIPFGTIAIDGGHIYDPDPAKRNALRANAYRWLNIAGAWGARRARVDSGGDEKMTDEQFSVIVEGYHDLIAYAKNLGIELLIENHWGASRLPANVLKILNACPGLGLLFDTYNWAPHAKAEGWVKCAKYARALHIKTFAFDEAGDEITENLPWIVRRLKGFGYQGPWGIESTPIDGVDNDELAAVKKTIALIRRLAA